MSSRTLKQPNVIYQGDKPTSVIVSIDDYRRLLERAEELSDIKELNRLKKQPLHLRSFEEFLEEHSSDVSSPN